MVWQLKHLAPGQHVHAQLPSNNLPNMQVWLVENNTFGVPFTGIVAKSMTLGSVGALYDFTLGVGDVGIVGALTLLVDVYGDKSLFVPIYCQVAA